ncbi:hypothetical protein F7734_33750 [Scytonema sp. UIC 10036]|uniref:hypothetical protein n=1 Tax=Scytonema sp. UIC 10036 TaxID=2304196 RepID=UPI0012DACD86|nr:hypothetical protein [Scytonema sp. UIC 10036]MUG97038.1 hypothetical protein [Scytonema sp. UIC 10036]
MSKKFKSLGGLLVLLATISFPAVVTAETETPDYESTNDVFERAFFKNDPNFYRNQSIWRQIDFILGKGSLLRNSFPEHEIARDAELMNILYRDALNQQATHDPYIRTPDLPNPYTSSVLMSPALNSSKLRTGTEFRFETNSPR